MKIEIVNNHLQITLVTAAEMLKFNDVTHTHSEYSTEFDQFLEENPHSDGSSLDVCIRRDVKLLPDEIPSIYKVQPDGSVIATYACVYNARSWQSDPEATKVVFDYLTKQLN